MPESNGRTLPRRVLGRALRPYSLAVSLATMVLAYAVLAGVAVGQSLDGPLGKAFGVAALVTAFWLVAGWWAQQDRWMVRGLLWSAALWFGVSGMILTEAGPLSVSGLLAGCWGVASGGAWLLEVSEGER